MEADREFPVQAALPEAGEDPALAAAGGTGTAALTAELLPDSISRFRRLRSARISEATW
jgi:hypothetical protein